MAKILVTGAGGYLASWIVKILLLEGHTVHGTVRNLQDSPKLAHLWQLAAGQPGHLELFEADLLQRGSFDEAMQGCSVAIHAASPYFRKSKAPEQELLTPAVEGTRNVLESVNRTDSVKRVVLTSSIVAMYGSAAELAHLESHMVQESDVNRDSTVASNPYALSKTLAEKAAWDMQKQQARWDMVTIHPGAIFGPSLSRRKDATSVEMMRQFLNGSFRTGVPKLWLGVADVRDVAHAHVRAATLSGASGRYLVVAESLTLLEIAKLIARSHPATASKLPTREVPKALMWLIAPLAAMTREFVARNVNHPIHFNNSRGKEQLSISYRSAADTLSDHARQLLNDGL
jgi:nucleoside-diphosphate-sugar epimerase